MGEASENDTYRTLAKPSREVLFKDRGSKFFGYAYPVSNEKEVEALLEHLRREHHKARHWCYAWQLGKQYEHYRANDDGEPSNSAGMPIYGQLQSYNVTNTLVVVVRYFGGNKLGVGGLIQAYKTAASRALDASKIVTRTINVLFLLKFEYAEMDTVMRLIKEADLTIVEQTMELSCSIMLSVRKKDAERVFALFDTTYKVAIKEVAD